MFSVIVEVFLGMQDITKLLKYHQCADCNGLHEPNYLNTSTTNVKWEFQVESDETDSVGFSF